MFLPVTAITRLKGGCNHPNCIFGKIKPSRQYFDGILYLIKKFKFI